MTLCLEARFLTSVPVRIFGAVFREAAFLGEFCSRACIFSHFQLYCVQ